MCSQGVVSAPRGPLAGSRPTAPPPPHLVHVQVEDEHAGGPALAQEQLRRHRQVVELWGPTWGARARHWLERIHAVERRAVRAACLLGCPVMQTLKKAQHDASTILAPPSRLSRCRSLQSEGIGVGSEGWVVGAPSTAW